MNLGRQTESVTGVIWSVRKEDGLLLAGCACGGAALLVLNRKVYLGAVVGCLRTVRFTRPGAVSHGVLLLECVNVHQTHILCAAFLFQAGFIFLIFRFSCSHVCT